jgi:hypothetical protein
MWRLKYMVPVKAITAYGVVEVEFIFSFDTKWTLLVKFMPVSFTSANEPHSQLSLISNDWLC